MWLTRVVFAERVAERPSLTPKAATGNSSSWGCSRLTGLCEHAYSVYGSKVGRAVCSAIGRADAVNSRLVALLTVYASDPDPEREEARTEAFTGDYFYGGDFLTAGLNSTRGQAALSAASLLFRSADHVDALMPTVDALAQGRHSRGASLRRRGGHRFVEPCSPTGA